MDICQDPAEILYRFCRIRRNLRGFLFAWRCGQALRPDSWAALRAAGGRADAQPNVRLPPSCQSARTSLASPWMRASCGFAAGPPPDKAAGWSEFQNCQPLAGPTARRRLRFGQASRRRMGARWAHGPCGRTRPAGLCQICENRGTVSPPRSFRYSCFFAALIATCHHIS